MTLYIRAYQDYSYEIIFLEGLIKKNRVHLLINPGKYVRLPGQSSEEGVEINIESLTHIISMETSVKNNDLIKRTTYIAERTNKPIITNQATSEQLKQKGLSIRQLRIIGFEQEVVQGVEIDPVYLEELSDEIQPSVDFRKRPVLDFLDKLNPLKWKPIKKITNTFTNSDEQEQEIDATKPLAFIITLGKTISVLVPLDKRGVLNVNRIIPQFEPNVLIVPNQDVSYTKEVINGLDKIIILNDTILDDEPLILPRTHNRAINHDTYYAGLEEWIEIE